MKPWRKTFLVLTLVFAAIFLGSGTFLVLKLQGTLGEITSQRVTVADLWALLFPSERADLLQARIVSEDANRFNLAVDVASEHEFVDVVFRPHDSGDLLQTRTARDPLPELYLESPSEDLAVAAPPVTPPAPAYLEDEDRLNILLLGIRGEDDPAGGLLTDTMILLSIHQSRGRVAMISIPRDLYVEIPGISGRHKINAAHAYGHIYYRDGLGLTMETVSRVAGVTVHHAVLLDFDTFEELIDVLDGITVYVDRPLVDPHEDLNLSPGYLHMDSDLALRFVRSRLTTTDFDRSRRQRQVLEVLRVRILESRNPLKYLDLLDTLGRNVRTTLSVAQIRELYELSRQLDLTNIIEFGFDTSPSGPLMSARSQRGEYIIIPRSGNFGEVQRIVRGIFN